MKKILLIFSILIVSAQVSKAGIGEVSVKNTSIKKVGDNVELYFEMEARDFPKDYKVTLVPVLYNQHNRAETLPPVSVAGRRKALSDTRVGMPKGDGTLLKHTDKEPLKYSASIPFKKWMQVVSIDIYQFDEGCCSFDEKERSSIADRKLIYLETTPYFSVDKLAYEESDFDEYYKDTPYLHPMDDYSKRYEILKNDREKGSAAVIFKVGSSVIDRANAKNTDALNAMLKTFKVIEKDPYAILKHIFIAGYASPEGPLSLNTRLADNRANSVKNALQSGMQYTNDEVFELYNGREDWEGLRKKVSESEMAEKDDILATIDSYTIEQEERKSKLARLGDGDPYKYMLANFYPPLRTAGYVQFYYEVNRKANVSSATPEKDDRGKWIDMDSPANKAVTAINDAIELMLDQKFGEALNTLIAHKNDKRTWNNIGVCYMMLQNFDEAQAYFEKAVDNGDGDAIKNLEQISWINK